LAACAIRTIRSTTTASLPAALPPGTTVPVRRPEEFTGKVGANFHMTDDMMLYGTISKGYKAGGVNLTLGTPNFEPRPTWSMRLA
jgi:iron complex outermembrane receptor protein